MKRQFNLNENYGMVSLKAKRIKNLIELVKRNSIWIENCKNDVNFKLYSSTTTKNYVTRYIIYIINYRKF